MRLWLSLCSEIRIPIILWDYDSQYYNSYYVGRLQFPFGCEIRISHYSMRCFLLCCKFTILIILWDYHLYYAVRLQLPLYCEITIPVKLWAMILIILWDYNSHYFLRFVSHYVVRLHFPLCCEIMIPITVHIMKWHVLQPLIKSHAYLKISSISPTLMATGFWKFLFFIS